MVPAQKSCCGEMMSRSYEKRRVSVWMIRVVVEILLQCRVVGARSVQVRRTRCCYGCHF